MPTNSDTEALAAKIDKSIGDLDIKIDALVAQQRQIVEALGKTVENLGRFVDILERVESGLLKIERATTGFKLAQKT